MGFTELNKVVPNNNTDAPPVIIARDKIDIPTACGLIFTKDGRYLLQLRDSAEEISFPNYWCLFGGMLELEESPEEGLKRELVEELEFLPPEMSYYTQLIFDLLSEDSLTRQRIYFEVPIDGSAIEKLVLHEGAGMAFMSREDIASQCTKIVPYDLAVLQLHIGSRA
jgi:8-oxo-dGTP pyrophosphatase MutT (NUDIX family)